MIYTFYSYKGGVGRTMALANIAELFYQAGLKVLMVDWDLEAPGLERFFPTILDRTLFEKRGIMDMLTEYKKQMSQELPSSLEDPTELLEKPETLLVDVYPNSSNGKLWFLPSGRRDNAHFSKYANAVLTFDWQDFYQNWEGERYFEWLRLQFLRLADIILIDSRTGLTEMGGVCTYQFADVVVMFCAANRQNLDGIVKMAHNFKRSELTTFRRGRSLEVLIVPARLEYAEGGGLNQFKRDFLSQFSQFVPTKLRGDPEILWELRIPYIPYYAYNELVAVRERKEAIAESISESFIKLAQAMSQLGPKEYQEKLQLLGDYQESVIRSQTVNSAPQHVSFTDREDELKQIFAPFAAAYYLLDAPAGYGKTEFLKESARRFKERDWQCAYVSIDENATLAEVVTALGQKLQLTSMFAQNVALPSELRLGGALRRQWSELANQGAAKEGLALLIDLDKKPSLPLVRELLQKLIPAIQKSLRALEFFANKHNRLRIIIAGRYLAARLPSRSLSGIKILPLSPFSYEVIQNSAGEYLASGNEKSIRQFSAHLFYLTGGHPGCMARLLEMYSEKGIAPDIFLEYFGETIWEDMIREVVLDVQDGIYQSRKEFHRILNRFSVFRYLDVEILKRMLADEGISDKNEYDLADELTATYLFDWKGRFLRDDVTRRLLVIRLRHEIAEEYPSLCQQAQRLCAERLQQSNVYHPEMWTIEYLFQSLQQHANAILDGDHRKTIRQTFLKQDLPAALQMFINSRNTPRGHARAEQEALKQAMKEDWEFRFTVNYYLREEEYNEAPYEALMKNIKFFFTSYKDQSRST